MSLEYQTRSESCVCKLFSQDVKIFTIGRLARHGGFQLVSDITPSASDEGGWPDPCGGPAAQHGMLRR